MKHFQIVTRNVYAFYKLDSLNAYYFCIFDGTAKRRVSPQKVTLTPVPTKNSKEDLFPQLTLPQGGWGLGSDRQTGRERQHLLQGPWPWAVVSRPRRVKK